MISSADCSIMIVSGKSDSSMCSVNGKASKIRNNSTSPIKHIIFSVYSQYATHKGETYWSDLFSNASRGSFQKGYKFTDGQTLCIKTNAGIQRYSVQYSDIQYIDYFYEGLKTFITNNSGVLSSDTDENVFSVLPKVQVEEYTWSGQIPASNQVVMINAFANDMAEEHFLSNDKREELRQSLIGKIFTGDLSGSDILRNGGYKISSIQGLTFDNLGDFFFTPKMFKQSTIKSKKSTVTTVDDEENRRHVFTCSKGLSVSLKHLYTKKGLL